MLNITDIDFINLVGSRLKSCMTFKKIDARELANCSGVSLAQIYRVISGCSNTPIKTLYKLVSSLKISFYAFFNFEVPIDSISNDINIYTFDDELKSLIQNLKIHQHKLSRLKGLTQVKIADELGLSSYKYIGYILNGKKNSYVNIKVSTLYNLCKCLELEDKLYTLFRMN